ncbi:MAG: FHA domain-containing protein [Vicinamibacteria bacterium]
MPRAGFAFADRLFVRIIALALAGAGLAAPAAATDLALLLDTSGSIGAQGSAQRQRAVEGLIQALPAGTAVTLYAFDDTPRLVLERTSDLAAVASAAAALTNQGHFTALNDAIFDAARALAEGPSLQRAIVVVSDGFDENSALVPEDGVTEARRGHIPVFTLGIARVREQPLRRIAKLSGGEYFAPGADPGEVVKAIALRTPKVLPMPSPAAAPAPAQGQAASAAVAARQPPTPALGNWAVAVVVGLVAALALSGLAFVVLRRGAAAGPSATLGAVEDEVEDVTLMAKREDIEEPGSSTLVLTLKPLLHVTRGPNFGRFFEVKLESATSIGRAKGNDVVLDDRAVSSQHCRVRRGDGGIYELVDLRSTNGTYLNERRVSRSTLSAGDVIKVGETNLQFRMDHLKS